MNAPRASSVPEAGREAEQHAHANVSGQVRTQDVLDGLADAERRTERTIARIDALLEEIAEILEKGTDS